MLRCRVCHRHNSAISFTALDTHGRHLVSRQTFPVHYCPNCQAYFLGPVEKKPNYYLQAYSHDYYPPPGFIDQILSHFSFLRTNIILGQFPKHKKISILDVGCGRGEFLKSLPDSRFTRTGLEINQAAAMLASAKGLNIISADIDDLSINHQGFDCITLWHVLEHLPNPTETLSKLRRMLNPNGILLLATPNSNSLGFNYGQKYYFHLDAPRHLFIPNQTNLSFMITKAKFSQLHFLNPHFEYPLDLFWSLQHSKLKYLIYPLYPVFKILSSETIYTLAIK